ncbi:MAG: VanZ family protein [Candidatus Ratteibacteria bacterium]|nr:VanZ family protein [Candidatus Ratteibacteria bacterium]
MRISKATVIIGIFIIVSAAFMRQLMEFFKAYFGERAFVALIGLILIMAGLAFVICIFKRNPGPFKISAMVMLLIAGMALAWQIELPVERIHILEYGLLGWFTGRDLMGKTKKKRGFIFAWVLTVMVGILDEGFQRILPYRVWDVRDILFNSLGGLWGISLYWLKAGL